MQEKGVLFQFIARDKLNKLPEKALVVIYLNKFILIKKLNFFMYTAVKIQGMQEKWLVSFQFIARDKLNKLPEKALVVVYLNNFILTKKLNRFMMYLWFFNEKKRKESFISFLESSIAELPGLCERRSSLSGQLLLMETHTETGNLPVVHVIYMTKDRLPDLIHCIEI